MLGFRRSAGMREHCVAIAEINRQHYSATSRPMCSLAWIRYARIAASPFVLGCTGINPATCHDASTLALALHPAKIGGIATYRRFCETAGDRRRRPFLRGRPSWLLLFGKQVRLTSHRMKNPICSSRSRCPLSEEQGSPQVVGNPKAGWKEESQKKPPQASQAGGHVTGLSPVAPTMKRLACSRSRGGRRGGYIPLMPPSYRHIALSRKRQFRELRNPYACRCGTSIFVSNPSVICGPSLQLLQCS
jgi:hypothetical protein